MRVLILDHYYEAFIEQVYSRAPGLSRGAYSEQYEALAAGLFGESAMQVSALEALGHQALFLPVNVPPLIEAMAVERDIRLDQPMRILSRLRVARALASGAHRRWLRSALSAIADWYRPDVIHIQCVDVIPPATVLALHRPGRLIVGQTATPLPAWFSPRPYHLLVSSLPTYVRDFAAAGVEARYLPLAFEPSIASLQAPDRDIEVSFVGSLSGLHVRRNALIESLARDMSFDIWSPHRLPGDGPDAYRASEHGPVWGRDMYHVLGRSKMTINVHGEVAAGYANCLRLFEATGMGAMLVTESAPNLDELFDVGKEVVTYADEAELRRVISYFRTHPQEAREIGEAGQRRTLRDHTWRTRMAQFVELAETLRSGLASQRTGLTSLPHDEAAEP